MTLKGLMKEAHFVYCAFSEAHILSTWPRINRGLLSAATIITALYIAFAIVLGKEPNLVEILWTWFCQAGCVYHLTEMHDAVRNRQVLNTWEEVDIIDVDVANTDIRHHFLRWAGKSIFLLVGLGALLVPPRADERLDFYQMIMTFFLLLGLFLLDFNAISDYSSRVWRQSNLWRVQHDRENRRKEHEHDEE